MTIAPKFPRELGTMVAYGFTGLDFTAELALAHRLGATVLEILPDWRRYPDPGALRAPVADAGLSIHSAHGCWGGQAIRAPRVDLGSCDPPTHLASVDDLKRCIDWLAQAGGRYLVVHPGGLSEPDHADARRDALARGLIELAEHARGPGLILGLENMPPGVHPGSRMADLFDLVCELDRPELALTLDTGHAHITATAASETVAAGRHLGTTHVHDNDGRQDSHLPPGLGSISWEAWSEVLDSIRYSGPIMLECIRHIRRNPQCLDSSLLMRLEQITGKTARLEGGSNT
jgi:sugar phosphate isomerase/epimerase